MSYESSVKNVFSFLDFQDLYPFILVPANYVRFEFRTSWFWCCVRILCYRRVVWEGENDKRPCERILYPCEVSERKGNTNKITLSESVKAKAVSC
jgi:hypothetical protein